MATTTAMVDGLERTGIPADIRIAVTGVASPGTANYPVDRPVGQIYVVISYRETVHRFSPVIMANERD